MKAMLDEQAIRFLKQLGIDIDTVFNATNLPRSKYRPLMKACGAIVAAGVTPCKAKGHQLRDAYGHCVMCNPSCLSHARRFKVDAFVYVAHSASARLVKVGYSENIADRIRQMNLQKPGGTTDWTTCKFYWCENAGRVESEVHRALGKFRLDVAYGAKHGFSKEIFRCGPRTAISALRKAVEISRLKEESQHDDN
jgi:hypothetical protein